MSCQFVRFFWPYELDRQQQAIVAFRQALRIRPDDVDAQYYLAGKLLKQIAKV